MAETQRVKLLRETAENLLLSNVILGDGEVCLINASGVEGNGYDSLIIGNGETEARSLKLIPLNVNKGSVFLGLAVPQTIPPSAAPGTSLFYLAQEGGTYEGFGGLIVEPGEIAFLVYRYAGWSKMTILQVDEELSEESTRPVQNRTVTLALKNLEKKITEGQLSIPVDAEFSEESENPIMNRTVTTKFKEYDDWYVE